MDLAGRVHPLVVHFPVALLLLAGAVLMVTRGRAQHRLAPALDLLVYVAAAMALAAAITGWLLADLEHFQGRAATVLNQHRWAGVAVAALAIGAALSRLLGARRAALRTLSGGLLLISATTVAGAGYLGAELVYGEGHLTRGPDEDAADVAETPEPNPSSDEAPAPAADDGRVDFRRQVQPVLRRACHKCHSGRKQEGELRLDRKDLAMAGGEEGVVIVPGDPDHSELIRRISLPHDDEDYMPSKGKPLTPAQVSMLRDWISQGADWPE